MMKFLLLMGVAALASWPVWAQETAKAETTTTTTTTETSVIATPAPAESRGEDWELCPEPSMALTQVPSEMDELQADIDRYTLCLNRAELLLKLEDLKNQNKEASVDGLSLPISPTPLTAEQTTELMADGSSPQAMAPPPQDDYAIRDIRGMGDMLMARLQSPDGDFEQVKIGDKLADGSEVRL